MELFNRESLKNFFKNGATPTESSFAGLIDSTVNKLDDGFSKNPEDGIRLAPIGQSTRLMSFYRKVQDQRPAWDFRLDPSDKVKGLQLSNSQNRPVLFLSEQGFVGVGKNTPRHALDIQGTLSTDVRIGRMQEVGLFADGEWHVVKPKVAGVQLFEVVARVQGHQKRGKHAISHAFISCVHGKGKVKASHGVFGWFWDRIVFRVRTNDDYSARIEVKTRTHYGTDENGNALPIKLHICALWETDIATEDE